MTTLQQETRHVFDLDIEVAPVSSKGEHPGRNPEQPTCNVEFMNLRKQQPPSQRTMRRPGPKKWQGDARGQIKDMVSIRERPASVEDRAVPGHWEGDLLSGPQNSYIAPLVERHSRYVMLVKVANKNTQTVISALIKQSKKLPSELYKSLTWDRGKELTDHRQFTLATDIDVYFCDPRSPWQRGTNENTNGLLRQYFPKGSDFSKLTVEAVNRTVARINLRPRKRLGWKTPYEVHTGVSVALMC